MTAPAIAPDAIAYDDVTVRRAGNAIVDRVTLKIAQGSFVALTGASGAGKTTLLRLVNRMVRADAGRVRVFGEDVADADPPELRRGIGYASQGVGLFPHWTVAENIAAVPWLLRHAPRRRAARVAELLDLVELPRDFGDRFPRQLSGGQASRVGLARALAAEPRLLLLDEPFGALDPETRVSLADKISELHDLAHLTTLMVTHDLADALTRVQRVIVCDAGRIVADGTPASLVASTHPAVVALIAAPLDQADKLAALRHPELVR
ncbi:ABC transporter ATP-binding protein [alpha proteobacterium AAP81b]|nr:ABC transporter ATP-binding protein [alpha proteobacterium AAP81b]